MTEGIIGAKQCCIRTFHAYDDDDRLKNMDEFWCIYCDQRFSRGADEVWMPDENSQRG